jgi:hypothetical protein
MTPDEMESAMQAAFNQCDAANCPLNDQQKEILMQMLGQVQLDSNLSEIDENPLNELAPEELQLFLGFVKNKEAQNVSWKVQLLNDWLQGEDSGEVHFIRQRYGVQWLDRLERRHFDTVSLGNPLKLKIGDRIEVCNALWEWVPPSGISQEGEWYPCTVIQIKEVNDGSDSVSNCTVRFQNGSEYEIPGIYQWNQSNWRWTK